MRLESQSLPNPWQWSPWVVSHLHRSLPTPFSNMSQLPSDASLKLSHFDKGMELELSWAKIVLYPFTIYIFMKQSWQPNQPWPYPQIHTSFVLLSKLEHQTYMPNSWTSVVEPLPLEIYNQALKLMECIINSFYRSHSWLTTWGICSKVFRFNKKQKQIPKFSIGFPCHDVTERHDQCDHQWFPAWGGGGIKSKSNTASKDLNTAGFEWKYCVENDEEGKKTEGQKPLNHCLNKKQFTTNYIN